MQARDQPVIRDPTGAQFNLGYLGRIAPKAAATSTKAKKAVRNYYIVSDHGDALLLTIAGDDVPHVCVPVVRGHRAEFLSDSTTLSPDSSSTLKLLLD